jgi:SAM-dependent methyltransferase
MTFEQPTAAFMRGYKRGDEDDAVAFLADLGRAGPALELGIGTGRIALPLAATGIRVDGIDISPHVVAELRAQPGGDKIKVTMGDFADMPVEGLYRLIYVPFNSFFNLLTQDDEVRCFQNVAAHLTDDGCFVIEGGMNAEFLRGLDDYQYVRAEHLAVDEVWLDVLRLDPTTQVLEENHIRLTANGIRFQPVMQRYAWPAEMDLMARIAGLRLKERWGGWDRRPWTARSSNVVSVWGK